MSERMTKDQMAEIRSIEKLARTEIQSGTTARWKWLAFVDVMLNSGLIEEIEASWADNEKLRAELTRLLDLATEMRGFVKVFGLSDSDYDRWRKCRDALDAARGLPATGTAVTGAASTPESSGGAS